MNSLSEVLKRISWCSLHHAVMFQTIHLCCVSQWTRQWGGSSVCWSGKISPEHQIVSKKILNCQIELKCSNQILRKLLQMTSTGFQQKRCSPASYPVWYQSKINFEFKLCFLQLFWILSKNILTCQILQIELNCSTNQILW